MFSQSFCICVCVCVCIMSDRQPGAVRVDIWRDRCDGWSCEILVSRVKFQKISGSAWQFTQSEGHCSCSHHNLCMKSLQVSNFVTHVSHIMRNN